MRLTFPIKLMGIVGIAALAFILLITVNGFITKRVNHQVDEIQRKYIPFIELGPQLEDEFKNLRRNFQDAVSARDMEMLEKTAEDKKILIDHLDAVRDPMGVEKVKDLQAAFEEYYLAAYNISSRLMSGETGVTFVTDMSDMQAKQARLDILLKDATAFDRNKLDQTFSAVTDALRTAARFQLGVDLLCLILVIFFSVLLSRDVISNLTALKGGFKRFGKNDFSEQIKVAGNDEFGDVAKQANQMATYMEGLLKEREEQATNLKITNRELEAASHTVASDLRLPLHNILYFTTTLLEDVEETLPANAKHLINRINSSAQKMSSVVNNLLNFSRISRVDIEKESVNLSQIANNIVADLKKAEFKRKAYIEIKQGMVAKGDPKLLDTLLVNLIGNAWKFTSKNAETHIELGSLLSNGVKTYFIKDNGVGFDMIDRDKLFGRFQRLHSSVDYEGLGLGLVTAQKIVQRHDGKIWAESEPNKGATFFFTLG